MASEPIEDIQLLRNKPPAAGTLVAYPAPPSSPGGNLFNNIQAVMDEYKPIAELPIGASSRAAQRVNTENHIGQLLHYHVNVKPRIDALSIINIFASIAFASLSLWLYFAPTKDLAGGDNFALAVLLSCVLIANFGVAAFATSESIESFRSKVPDKVAKEMNEDAAATKVQRFLLILTFGLLAIGAALPYAASTSGAAIYKVMVLAGNIPMNYYALNKLTLSFYRWAREKCARSRESQYYYRLLKAFNYTIDEVSYRIVTNTVQGASFPAVLEPRLPGEEGGPTPEQLVQFFAQQAIEFQIPANTPLSLGAFLGRRLLPTLLGTFVVLTGLSPYLLKLYENLPSNPVLGAFVILGVTAFLALAAKFGSQTFQEIADYITRHSRDSLPMLLHRKLAWSILLAIVFVDVFSFGTSVDLIKTSPYSQEGARLHDLMLVFMGFAWASSFIFNNQANQQLRNGLMETYDQHFGIPKNKKIANFYIQMRAFLDNVNNFMTPMNFATSLKALTDDQRIALLGLDTISLNVNVMIELIQGNVPHEDQATRPDAFSFSALTASARKTLLDGLDHLRGKNPDELYDTPANERVRIVHKELATASTDSVQDLRRTGPGFWKNCSNITSCWPDCLRFGKKSIRDTYQDLDGDGEQAKYAI